MQQHQRVALPQAVPAHGAGRAGGDVEMLDQGAEPGDFRMHGRLCRRAAHHALLGGRCEKLRSNTPSAIRFFSISMEPPAIIQPRVRRTQYSTRDSWLNPMPPMTCMASLAANQQIGRANV